MTTSPSLVPDTADAGPLHFVLCDFGKLGLAIVETDPAAADEATLISNMLSGQYDAPLAVIAVDLAAGTSRDVSAEIARKMAFAAGHRLRLDIQPRDGLGSAPYTHFNGDYNSGTNTLHMGGRYDSHPLLPVVPD